MEDFKPEEEVILCGLGNLLGSILLAFSEEMTEMTEMIKEVVTLGYDAPCVVQSAHSPFQFFVGYLRLFEETDDRGAP